MPNNQGIQYIGLGAGGLYTIHWNRKAAIVCCEVQKELQCAYQTETVVKSSFTVL